VGRNNNKLETENETMAFEIKDVEIKDVVIDRAKKNVYEVVGKRLGMVEVVVKKSANENMVGQYFWLETAMVVVSVNAGSWWMAYRAAENRTN
jgi:hypothetical protein